MKDQKFLLYKGHEIESINVREDAITVIYKDEEPDLPKSWEELGKIEGWYVGSYSNLESVPFHDKCEEHLKNTFPTKAEAEASIALAQLCQLRDRYNGEKLEDWVDWTDSKQNKWILGNSEILHSYYERHVLAFKSHELAEQFLKNFSDLIEKAKPLL